MSQLTKGDRAPEFRLLDQNGNNVSLQDFEGEKLMIYFYPKADTPGCTVQACAVRDARSELLGVGLKTLGISPDPPAAQLKFDHKYSLGFTLLSDPAQDVAKAYGAFGEKKMFGKASQGIIRSSFLIDEQGRIAEAWYSVKPDLTVPNALASVG